MLERYDQKSKQIFFTYCLIAVTANSFATQLFLSAPQGKV